jgi:hypothetical protein
VAKPGVHLTIFVYVRSDHPGARLVVEIEDAAFADVDEETNVFLASGEY